VTTELGAAVVATAPASAPPLAQRTQAAADATVSDITDAISGAIHLGVSLFLFPALYLMSPIVVGVALTCILSLNCGPNDPRRSFVNAYYYLIDPAMRLIAPLFGAKWGETTAAPSSIAADRPVGTRTTTDNATGASKRALTKPGILPLNAARVHQKLKAPAAQRNNATPGRAQAGSARKH
jgi:hypothetical protein